MGKIIIQNWHDVYFYTNYRAIDLNTLIGYIGGYIGLILGCSFFQIPDFILMLYLKGKKYFGRSNATVSNASPYPREINVEEISQNKVALDLGKRNANRSFEYDLSPSQSELDDLSLKLDKFSQEFKQKLDEFREEIEKLEY